MTVTGLCWMLSPPDGRAGAGQRVLQLAHAVSDAGVGVRLIRPHQDDVRKPLHERCVELAQRWQVERPRWVYVEVPEPDSEPWRRVARHLQIPLLTTWHPIAWMSPTTQQADLGNYLRSFLGDCRHVLAETPVIRQALATSGILNCTVVSNGVDGQRFHPRRRSLTLREQWGAKPDTVVALHVGRLEPQKNLGLLARAMLAVRAANPNTILVCVGAGTGRDQLARDIPGLVLPGFLEEDALADAYAAGDLFLFPSLDDPYGNVVLEAAASGLAVVAFDRAAAGMHLRDGAALVPVGDESAFVDEARRLSIDRAARSTLTACSTTAAARCSWKATAAAFITAINRAEHVIPPSQLPGVHPIAVTVTAPLPEDHDEEPFASFRMLFTRGHHVAWHDAPGNTVQCDQQQLSLSQLTQELPPPDTRGAWSRRTESIEARLMACVAGNPPPPRSLRIAAVLSAPNATSGSARRFGQLIAGLRCLGHPVQVQAQTAGQQAPLPLADPLHQQQRLEHFTAHFLDTWRTDRPDIVHIELLDSFGASAGRAASTLGIPWTLTWHPLSHHVPKSESAAVMATLIQLASHASGIIAECTAQCADLQAHGLSVAGVVGNGVDALRFSPAHRNPLLRESWQCQFAVLAVGRLLANKNAAELIPIAQALRTFPGARLIVVGDGPERSALMTALPEALWLGEVADNDLPAIYASADLFIATSRVDGYSLVVLEAIASGLPVIGYDQGAVSELVQSGENGWKVPLDGTLAALIHPALKMVTRPDKMAKNPKIEDLTWASRAQQLENIFLRLSSRQPVR